MRKQVLKKIAILAVPIIWRKIRGHHGYRHGHYHSHRCGHEPRRVWL